MVKRFEPWFDLSAPLEKYIKTGNLTEFEVSMDQMIVAKFLPRFRSLVDLPHRRLRFRHPGGGREAEHQADNLRETIRNDRRIHKDGNSGGMTIECENCSSSREDCSGRGEGARARISLVGGRRRLPGGQGGGAEDHHGPVQFWQVQPDNRGERGAQGHLSQRPWRS